MIRTKKKHVDAPIDPEKLQAYVTRIEAVEELIVAERDARADIYTEVKSSGMKPKMVRKIVKERAKKAVDEAEEAELERYRAALAVPGATYRSVAAKTGVPRSTLHRLVPRDEKRDTPETVPDAPGGGAEGPRMASGTSPKPYCRECEGTGIIVYDDGGKIHGQEPCPICRVEEEPPTDEAGAVAEPSAAQRVADHEIDLTIPARLDRRARA
jgi:uncharacterized protein (UPF0335 family)